MPQYGNVTTRHPDSSGRTQESAMMGAVTTSQQGWKGDLFKLFSQGNYSYFSTKMIITGGDPGNYGNVESIHDDVHVQVGGQGGWMFDPPVAGFDPIFWLHHAMVDRSFALWQAMHPGASFDTITETSGTYSLPTNTMVDSGSALTPFHSDKQGDFYVSASVWDTTVLGYTYPELSNGATQASVTTAVNKLYGDAPISMGKRHAELESRQGYGNVNASGSVQEYSANIRVNLLGLGGSIQIFIFDGPFDDNNAAGWLHEKNLIGSAGFFANSVSPGNVYAKPVTSTTLFTAALVEKVRQGALKSLSIEDVTTFLTNNIQWRVRSASGNAIPISQISELTISIVTSQVTPAASLEKLPTWGEYQVLEAITRGKAGGLQNADQV